MKMANGENSNSSDAIEMQFRREVRWNEIILRKQKKKDLKALWYFVLQPLYSNHDFTVLCGNYFH